MAVHNDDSGLDIEALDRAGEWDKHIRSGNVNTEALGRAIFEYCLESTPRDNTIALALISIADSLAKLANGRESERGI